MQLIITNENMELLKYQTSKLIRKKKLFHLNDQS